MSGNVKGLVPTAATGAPARVQVNAGEVRRKVRLKDIVMHPMDVSVPIAKQVAVYANMASGPAARAGALPPIRVGYWIAQDAGVPAVYAESSAKGGNGGGSTSVKKNGGAVGDVPELAEYVPKSYYLLADGDMYRGFSRSGGVKEVECIVVQCADESDFLARHTVANQRPTGYDPMRLGHVVRHLQALSRGGAAQDGRTISQSEADGARRAVEDVMKSCRDTVDQKFINLVIDEDASRELSELCEWLGNRLSRFVLPYYIPHAISKVPSGLQGEFAEYVSQLVRRGAVSDVKFSWPAPEEIEVAADTPRFRAGSGAITDGRSGGSGAGRTAAKSEDEEDEGEGEEEDDAESDGPAGGKPHTRGRAPGRTGTAAQTPAKRPSGPADQVLLQNSRDTVVIPGTDKHPPYVVDKRTNRVSIVDEHEKVTVLREVGDAASRRGAYLMPVQACEWLGLPGTAAAVASQSSGGSAAKNGAGSDDGNAVRVFKFDSPAGLAKLLRQQEKKKDGRSRGVVIYK